MLLRWGRLHAVRSVLSLIIFVGTLLTIMPTVSQILIVK